MVDYPSMIATAQRLIEDAGRTVRFYSYNETPTDSTKPWNGPGDPRKTPEDWLDVSGCFVPVSSVSGLGNKVSVDDLVKRSMQIMIVSAGASVDLTEFQEVEDDEKFWKITGMEVLQPGDDIVLTVVGLTR